MLLLNPQQHVNVLLKKLFHQIVILPVHQLIMKPLMITLVIPHMNDMHHQLTMSGNIMQENMGNNI